MFKRLTLAILGATTLLVSPYNCNAKEISILATNDTHSQIMPDEIDNLGGILRRKVIIDSIRDNRGHDNVMLVDAGDAVQGTLFFTLFKGEVENELMNKLGYQLRILGNHEFDNGIDALADLIAKSNAQWLTTNYDLTDAPALDSLFAPYSIMDTGSGKIGFIALNLDPKGMISTVNAQGVRYTDPYLAGDITAKYLKKDKGVDYVVALSHIGYDNQGNQADDINLVANSRNIDLVIGGHTHTVINPTAAEHPQYLFPNLDNRNILITQTGTKGVYLTEIVLDTDSLQSKNYIPTYRLIEVNSHYDKDIDPNLQKVVDNYLAATEESMKKPVATTNRLMPRKSEELLNYVSDFILARGKELADSIDFAIVNRGGIRQDLPKGTVTEGMIISMLPFSNRVQIIDIKGEDLLPAFNQMAAIGGNGVSDGVDITYKNVTVNDKVEGVCTKITIDGAPFDPERTYRVATIDYLADGGDYMPTLRNGKTVAFSANKLYDDVLDMLRKQGKKAVIDASDYKRMHTEGE